MTFDLDTSQRTAVDIAPEDRQIVLAGPGGGKSEVVGALAAHLVEDEEVDPDEILVISFSRAAVDVVEQRTAEVVDEGETVEVRTIDSLAHEVIVELSDDEPAFRGYDKAIQQATELLRGADEPVFETLRHIVIDEVQDVVGVRADFVLALLRRGVATDTGFTLLGDTLQALYDFQLTKEHPKTCFDLLQSIKESFDPRVVELNFDHRSRTDTARAISSVRSELLNLVAMPRLRRLQAALADISPLGDFDQDAVETVAAWSGRTAFLCDTNARAALTAQRLSEFGLRSETATSVLDAGLPPWIARALADHESDTIEFDEFTDLAEGSGCPDPVASWRLARSLDHSGSALSIPRLAAALNSPRGRGLFRRTPQSPVLVSTVHRAKGLEFDNVVLVDPNDWSWEDDTDRASTMLYVAMSRAYARVTTVDGISTQQWHRREDAARAIWTREPWRKRGLLGFIVEPWMARDLGPTECRLDDLVGQPVTWEEGESFLLDGDEIPSWVATVGDSAVAKTGVELGQFITRKIFGSVTPTFRGARVDGLETAVGAPHQDALGHHGMWLATRLSGPVELDWK